MASFAHSFQRDTGGFTDIHNITEEVESALHRSGLTHGIAVVSVPGSTAGITTIEFESGAVADLNDENVRRLSDALAADDALPAIVHCKSGNRVGALLALEAHGVDGLPAGEAIGIGMRTGLTRLAPDVREKLGLPPVEP